MENIKIPINLTLEKAVEILNYSSDWNADMFMIEIDLMDFYPGYIINWNEIEQKFKSSEETQVDDYMNS